MKNRYSRIAVFIALWLASTVPTYGQYQLNVYAAEMMRELGLSTSAFASLFTAPMFPAIFLSILAGKLSDRLGAGRIIFVGLAITCASFICRIWIQSFFGLWICMALSGASAIAVNVNSARIISGCIDKKRAEVFMGVFTTGGMLAQSFATATSASLFRERNGAFICAAVYSAVVLLVWCTQINKVGHIAGTGNGSGRGAMKGILQNRGIWLTAFCLFCTLGATVTLNTFLPAGLTQLHGFSPKKAGTVASMVSLGSLMGSVLGPVIYKKCKSFSLFAGGFSAFAAMGCIFGFMPSNTALLTIIYLLTGLALGGVMPIYYLMPVMLRDIDKSCASTAGGLITTFQLAGAVVVPTYIISPLAGGSYQSIFFLSGICIIIVIALSCMLARQMEAK